VEMLATRPTMTRMVRKVETVNL